MKAQLFEVYVYAGWADHALRSGFMQRRLYLPPPVNLSVWLYSAGLFVLRGSPLDGEAGGHEEDWKPARMLGDVELPDDVVSKLQSFASLKEDLTQTLVPLLAGR